MLVEDSTKSIQDRKLSELQEQRESLNLNQKNSNILDFLHRNKPAEESQRKRTPAQLTETKS